MVSEIESVPGSLIEPLPVKRGRGRPPKVDPATGERVNPPKGTGRAPAKRTPAKRPAARPRAPKSLYPELAATLSVVNTIFAMSPLGSKFDPETMQIKQGDELDESEITLLAKSLDAQCQRSPRFRKQVERVLGVGAGGQIIAVLGMIGARRMSRHGVLPPMIDPMIGAMISGGDLGDLAAFVPTPDADTAEAVKASTGEEAPQPIGDLDFDKMG